MLLLRAVFTDPVVQRLWDAGRILAAYEASTVPEASSSEHPFRDQHQLLADARRWHERGVLCRFNARMLESSTALAKAHELRHRALGDQHPDTLATVEAQAAAAHSPEKFASVVDRLIDALGENHLRVAIARRNYAGVLRDLQRYEEARATLALATAVLDDQLPAEDPERIAVLKVDALLRVYEDDCATAIAQGARAMQLGKRIWNPAHPFIAAAELVIAFAELRSGSWKSARKRLPSVSARLEAAYGDHPLVAVALWRAAQVAVEARYAILDVEDDMRRALVMFERTGSDTAVMQFTLFQMLYFSGRTLEATELAESLFAQVERNYQCDMASSLAWLWNRAMDPVAARRWGERARESSPDKMRATWTETLSTWEAKRRDTRDT